MSTYDEQMRELRERFIERARDDRAALREALASGDLEAARFIAHKLAGAAGIFGFDGISVTASALERAIPSSDQQKSTGGQAAEGRLEISASTSVDHAAQPLLAQLDQLD